MADAGLTAEDVIAGVRRMARIPPVGNRGDKNVFTEIVEFGEAFCLVLGI